METLVAQIRARMAAHQQQRIDLSESLSRSAPDPLCDDADVVRAIDTFHDHPVKQTFSTALACILIQAAQRFVDILRAHDGTRVRWDNTSAKVARYETAAYLWSLLSTEVRDSVRHDFEAERDAVAGGMLGGVSVVGRLIAQAWPAFSPETYTLSRVMFYPRNHDEAAEGFCRVLAASAGMSLPLSSEEIRNLNQTAGSAERGMLAILNSAQERIYPELQAKARGLVSHYLSYRLD